MKKNVIAMLLVICFCLLSQNSQAQTERHNDTEISEINQYQFYLEKPAVGLELLEYAKEATPIKGNVTGDGMKVIMDGYVKKGRVRAIVIYADGTTEEVFKSSCFIDPVIPL